MLKGAIILGTGYSVGLVEGLAIGFVAGVAVAFMIMEAEKEQGQTPGEDKEKDIPVLEGTAVEV